METGFIPRVGRRGVLLSAQYTKHYTGLVRRLRSRARYERLEKHAGQRTNERRDVSGSIKIQNFLLWLGPSGIIMSRMATSPTRIEFYDSTSLGLPRSGCQSRTLD